VAWRESLEHRREVLARVVVGHAQPHDTADGLFLQRRMGLDLQIEHATRIAEQHLAFLRELQLTWPAHQQTASRCGFQLLDLHAHGRLRAMHLGRRR